MWERLCAGTGGARVSTVFGDVCHHAYDLSFQVAGDIIFLIAPHSTSEGPELAVTLLYNVA